MARPRIRSRPKRPCAGTRRPTAGCCRPVGVFGSKERVVEVELAHGHTIGPCRPFRRVRAVDTEDPTRRPAVGRRCNGWRKALRAGCRDRARVTDAALTAALSMTRLMIISAVCSGTSTGSTAIWAILWARCSSIGKSSALRWVRTLWLIIFRTIRTPQLRCKVPSHAYLCVLM